MKNTGQHNPAHRQYEKVIADAKAKATKKTKTKTTKAGINRRRVDDLMEQRQLEQELNSWY